MKVMLTVPNSKLLLVLKTLYLKKGKKEAATTTKQLTILCKLHSKLPKRQTESATAVQRKRRTAGSVLAVSCGVRRKRF